MKFNRNKPYGIISPGFYGASYEQNGHFFNSAYELMHIEGHSPSIDKKRELLRLEEDADGPNEADLILMADDKSIGWGEFRKMARGLLDVCPGTKEAIVVALKEQIVSKMIDASAVSVPEEKEQPETEDEEFKGLTWGDKETDALLASDAPEAEKKAPQPPEKQTPVNDGPVDLAEWGRGKIEYLFSDIQQEIRTRYSRQVSEKRDAIDVLIEQKLVNEDEAMRVE